ncbi:hypothetical protein RHGRI_013403 [Rhododendron griersonianum]|uniref:OTU domain-containing protein n=1 Tax=Rhododendron griersonianum TaxID=479676 RepID=A0AAV6K5I4_9ERIC|nr:hypothetical protein RHGRI_013403 [Rhododendron griersonianum]
METSIASSPSIDKQEIVDPSIHHDLESENHTMEVEKQVTDVVVTEQKPQQEVFSSDEALVDWIRKYIEEIIDVKRDGNCGYQAIAVALGHDENEWTNIRKILFMELEHYFSLYEGTCGDKELAKELRHKLNFYRSPAPKDRWMIMPEMGHLIASVFQVVVVFLSNHQCLTFLPLRYPPLPLESRRLIALGHVNGDHFVMVHLRLNSPIPPIARNWYIHHYSFADGWDTQYSKKIEEFKNIVGKDVATTDIIELD